MSTANIINQSKFSKLHKWWEYCNTNEKFIFWKRKEKFNCYIIYLISFYIFYKFKGRIEIIWVILNIMNFQIMDKA